MWEEMVSKAEWSSEAKYYSKKIFDYLNTVTINGGLWRGTNKDFVTHWCEQLHLNKEYSDQLSLTDTVKISLLQKAVSCAPHLKVVETQTSMSSVRLTLWDIVSCFSLQLRTMMPRMVQLCIHRTEGQTHICFTILITMILLSHIILIPMLIPF
jgi:hypothetical protein